MDRRLFLGSLGTAAATTFAGCGQAPSPAEGDVERTDSTVASTPVETATPTPEAPEVPLPGPPVRTASGTLEVQDASALVDAESQGFDGSADEYEFETEPQASFDRSEATANPDDGSVSLEVAADHVGTGRAFGLAAGAFQTAWEAPVGGRYRLSSSYTRYADILYDFPDDGDVSASFDTSLLAVSHETGGVNSRRTHPELQHKNGRLRRELAEWFLEVGVTYLVATSFGLGLVARVVLAQVMDNLIELNQSVGSGGSEIYDVYHRVQPNRGDPIELTVEFDASEGEVFVFELSPSLEFGFELRNSWWYQPTSVGSAEWRSFRIERIG